MNLDSAVFYSSDITTVIPFYQDILGFELEYQTDNFVSFIFPNGAKLGIKTKAEEREIPGAQTVFIRVEDIIALYDKYKVISGVTMYKDLIKQDWGSNFSILDPDGNKVQFVEKAETA